MPIINKGIFDTGDAFLRQTGNDWPTAQVISTADIIESSGNLYFTNTRAINALTIGTVTGNIAITGTLIANGLIIRNIAVSDSVLTGSTTANNIVADSVTSNTWNRLYTANVIETAGNLYFTNARVAANVATLLKSFQGSGLTIDAANGQINISAAASANFASNATVANTVLSLAGLTTTNLNEGSNLYFTPARVLSSISAGQGIAISANGIIQTLGNDTGLGLFNSGINLQGNAIASSAYSNVKSFVAGEGNSFIAFSLHVTNLAANTSYLTGRTITDGNTVLFANLLEIPVGGSLEIFRKPQVFRIGDSIQVQGLNNNKVAADGLISTYLSYQGSVDDNFRRSATTLTDNTLVPLLQTVSRTSIIESINLVNLGANIIPTSVFLTDAAGVVQATLASNLLIPAYASVELCEYPKSLPDNWYVKAQKFDNPAGSLSVYTSSKFTSSFTAIPSTTSITELGSNTVTFNILTTNILDNTLLYYATDALGGNNVASDFVTANTGSITILNNQATLTLTANSDQNTNFEGDETFKVVFRKGSSTGSVVLTTDTITVKDTSNTIVYRSLVEDGSTIAEGGAVAFTLNTTNLGPNNTIYYTTVGNVTTTDFVTGNTGSFVSTGNSYTLSFTTLSNIPANETRYFQLQLRTGSLTGPVQITSNVITVVDSLQAFVIATGGTEFINDGYKSHIFTTSGNFTVSGLGLPANRNLYYEIVAGGGGGGGSYPGRGMGGGGGGAGGFLQGNTTLSTTGTFAMVIGGGGTEQYTTSPGNENGTYFNSGSNSSILSNTFITIGGGGGGGNFPPGTGTGDGKQGGSGGGGAGGYLPGASQWGQGYPGGSGITSGPSNEGGGGGGATQSGNVAYFKSPTGQWLAGFGGNGISSVIISNIPAQRKAGWGTAGPVSGTRYFAGGGGGGSINGVAGYGSIYGGGGAGSYGNPSSTTPGTSGTGGGGGGSGWLSGSGAAGGSGWLAVRYPYTVQTYNFVANAFNEPNMVEASNIFIDLRTINVSNGSILYYTTVGNVTSSDFVTGNTGSFTILNSNALLQFRLANNIVTGNNTKNFGIQIRSGSNTGPILTTSNTFIINSSQVGYYSMSTSGNGGNVSLVGDYTIITFNTSANLNVVTAASIGFADVEIILVAGGGGSGGYVPGSSRTSGGGGGGGVVYRANARLTSQPYPIVIGAGGGGGQYDSGSNGTDTTGFSVTATGGGHGGSGSNFPAPYSGYPGGNGGGGSSDGLTGGTATQGSYSGWISFGNPGSGSSGGSAGATYNISGTSTSYGNGGGVNQYGPTSLPTSPGTGNGGIGTWGGYGPGAGYPTAGSPGVVIVRYRRPTN